MLASIRQGFTDYYNALPNKVLIKTGASAVFSFALSVYLNSGPGKVSVVDLSKPLFSAGIAALASLIHGLATPLFNKLLGPRVTWIEEFAKMTVVTVAASAVVNAFSPTTNKISEFVLYAGWSMNCISSILNSTNWQSSDNSMYLYWN